MILIIYYYKTFLLCHEQHITEERPLQPHLRPNKFIALFQHLLHKRPHKNPKSATALRRQPRMVLCLRDLPDFTDCQCCLLCNVTSPKWSSSGNDQSIRKIDLLDMFKLQKSALTPFLLVLAQVGPTVEKSNGCICLMQGKMRAYKLLI